MGKLNQEILFGGKFNDLLMILDVGPSTNKWYLGTHWGSRATMAKRWHKLVEEIVLVQGIKQLRKPVVLLFKLWMGKGRQLYDSSNCSATGKLIEDGLVRALILEDDKRRYVRASVYTCDRSPFPYSYTEVKYMELI